jgi:uncharacterized protein YjlB
MNEGYVMLLGDNRAEVIGRTLADDGTFPNNEQLPLLAYKGALRLPGQEPAAAVESLFATHGWGGSWRNGVYSFHHYHSTAHEVLGVYSGTAAVQFGGPGGVVLEVERGDVVLIPAGVSHKNVGSSPDFRVVGAYPRGQRPDMNYGREDERPGADERIAQVARPQADPVYGQGGPLDEEWPASPR